MERHTHTERLVSVRLSAPVSGFSEQRHDVCVTCLFCKAEMNLGQCASVYYVCVYRREPESQRARDWQRRNESEFFSHHAEKLTPLSFYVLWCPDLYIAPLPPPFCLFTVAFSFRSSLSSGRSWGRALVIPAQTHPRRQAMFIWKSRDTKTFSDVSAQRPCSVLSGGWHCL